MTGSKLYFERLTTPGSRLVYRVSDADGIALGNVERRRDGTFEATRIVSLVRGETWRSGGHRTRAQAGRALAESRVVRPASPDA